MSQKEKKILFMTKRKNNIYVIQMLNVNVD